MSEANEIILPRGWASTHSGQVTDLEFAAVLVDGHSSVRDLNEYYKKGWHPHAEAKMRHATLVTLVRAKS